MAKPKLELKKKNDEELENFAQGIVAAMTGNAYFPTPVPALADVTDLIEAYSAKLQAITALNASLRTAYTQKEEARLAVERSLTYLANYVEIAAEGNEGKIESAGMSVRAGNTPVGLPSMVTNLAAAAGDFEGQIDLNWDPNAAAKTYDVDYRLHSDSEEWQRLKAVTASKVTVPSLTAGAVYAFRVRAVGTAGPGPWSDEAVKRAP